MYSLYVTTHKINEHISQCKDNGLSIILNKFNIVEAPKNPFNDPFDAELVYDERLPPMEKHLYVYHVADFIVMRSSNFNIITMISAKLNLTPKYRGVPLYLVHLRQLPKEVLKKVKAVPFHYENIDGTEKGNCLYAYTDYNVVIRTLREVADANNNQIWLSIDQYDKDDAYRIFKHIKHFRETVARLIFAEMFPSMDINKFLHGVMADFPSYVVIDYIFAIVTYLTKNKVKEIAGYNKTNVYDITKEKPIITTIPARSVYQTAIWGKTAKLYVGKSTAELCLANM